MDFFSSSDLPSIQFCCARKFTSNSIFNSFNSGKKRSHDAYALHLFLFRKVTTNYLPYFSTMRSFLCFVFVPWKINKIGLLLQQYMTHRNAEPKSKANGLFYSFLSCSIPLKKPLFVSSSTPSSACCSNVLYDTNC